MIMWHWAEAWGRWRKACWYLREETSRQMGENVQMSWGGNVFGELGNMKDSSVSGAEWMTRWGHIWGRSSSAIGGTLAFTNMQWVLSRREGTGNLLAFSVDLLCASCLQSQKHKEPAPSYCINGHIFEWYPAPCLAHSWPWNISCDCPRERGNWAWLPGERHLSQAGRIILKLYSWKPLSLDKPEGTIGCGSPESMGHVALVSLYFQAWHSTRRAAGTPHVFVRWMTDWRNSGGEPGTAQSPERPRSRKKDKDPKSWSQRNQDSDASFTPFCETMGWPLDCSKSQFRPRPNADNNNIYSTRCLWGPNEKITLAKYQPHGKYSAGNKLGFYWVLQGAGLELAAFRGLSLHLNITPTQRGRHQHSQPI